jgi:hypothetical protein
MQGTPGPRNVKGTAAEGRRHRAMIVPPETPSGFGEHRNAKGAREPVRSADKHDATGSYPVQAGWRVCADAAERAFSRDAGFATFEHDCTERLGPSARREVARRAGAPAPRPARASGEVQLEYHRRP